MPEIYPQLAVPQTTGVELVAYLGSVLSLQPHQMHTSCPLPQSPGLGRGNLLLVVPGHRSGQHLGEHSLATAHPRVKSQKVEPSEYVCTHWYSSPRG